MAADLQKKTNRYEGMLADALDKAMQTIPDGTHLGAAAADCLEVAESCLSDDRHFKADDDWVNALASFPYGYGWLDANVRMDLFGTPDDSRLFAM